MEIINNSPKYDVIVVGSGAGGGMATKILSDAGLKIALVEAGPYFDPANPDQMTQMKWPWESPRRGSGTTRAFGDFHMSYGDWKVEGEPYTIEKETSFRWWRSRMLGGRTNHWGRISLRFGPKDFKSKDYDGLGENWPISYDDIKPYYNKLDKLIGVFGTKENIFNEPDGFFLPPPKPRLHELFYIKGARKSGVTVIPSRLSILTKRINNTRGVCFYCGQCDRSCSAYADFSSSSCYVIPSLKGGMVDLYTNSMVVEVKTDKNGRATGVSYINKENGREYSIRGKVVVLAASACSSARILLNSKSKAHPNGLGNSSNLIGKYLHDSTGTGRSVFIPDLINRKIYNEDGVGGMHVYSPWWLDNKKLDFPRGYHIEISRSFTMPEYGFGYNPNELNRFFGLKVGGYGDKLREDVKKYYGSTIGLSGRGEAIPRKDNYCEIDPDTKDKWGIPVLKFRYKWSDYEIKQVKHMHDTFEELAHNMGGIALGNKPTKEQNYGISAPGEIIHEVGTTRMGDDPYNSVVNKYERLHDVDNVYVVDGGPFVSQADKNPTWTIMALSWRTSEYIIDQLKKQNI
jgi:choline dehydrogenase-like flavoprotein